MTSGSELCQHVYATTRQKWLYLNVGYVCIWTRVIDVCRGMVIQSTFTCDTSVYSRNTYIWMYDCLTEADEVETSNKSYGHHSNHLVR